MESNVGSSVRGVASLRWSGIACHSCIHSTLDAASPWHQVGAFESLVFTKSNQNNNVVMNYIRVNSKQNAKNTERYVVVMRNKDTKRKVRISKQVTVERQVIRT